MHHIVDRNMHTVCRPNNDIMQAGSLESSLHVELLAQSPWQLLKKGYQ